ncbi:hypothetical protein JCM18900_300 [Psychrobacter sp. JCM 18900]|nr:hypothetical protein JCM18900_300 [Psychrobacter sp. JCM 18900]
MIIAAVIAVNKANLFGLKEVIDADIIVSQNGKMNKDISLSVICCSVMHGC